VAVYRVHNTAYCKVLELVWQPGSSGALDLVTWPAGTLRLRQPPCCRAIYQGRSPDVGAALRALGLRITARIVKVGILARPARSSLARPWALLPQAMGTIATGVSPAPPYRRRRPAAQTVFSGSTFQRQTRAHAYRALVIIPNLHLRGSRVGQQFDQLAGTDCPLLARNSRCSLR
jgi:hypothetical protein